MNHQSRYDKITKLLNRLSDEELSRFARVHALTDEAFALALISEFRQPDEGDYHEMVEICFACPSHLGRYGSTFLDWERIAQKLSDVMDKADGMADGGDPLGAVMVARHILHLTCQEYEDDPCPDYMERTDCRERLHEVVERAVETIRKHLIEGDTIDKDTQTGLLKEVVAELNTLGKSRLYYIKRLVEEWTPYILPPKKFIRYIDGKLKKACGLDKESFALQKIQYLVRNGMKAEAEKCLPELCRYGNVRTYYADCLIAWKEYRQALALLDAGKDNFEDFYYHWDEKRLAVIRQMEDKEAGLEECRKRFLNGEYRMKWYEALKEQVEATKWKDFLNRLLDECDFYMDIEDAEAKIYIEEGMEERLINFFNRNSCSDFEDFRKYGKHLPKADLVTVMLQYTERIKELSMGMRNRSDYRALKRWIETLKDVTPVGNEKLLELIGWLRNRHCGRPAMMEEINRIRFNA